MRTLSFVLLSSFLVLCLTGCGGKEGALLDGGALGNGGGLDVTIGAAISAYSFDEATQTCLNEEGEQGYNEELGECADLSALYRDEVVEAIEAGTDLTGSDASGVDFSGVNSVDEEYVMVNALKYDDSTVLGDGTYADETHMSSSKNDLCAKWLSKKNKKTGAYPAGIQKKIDRLKCE